MRDITKKMGLKYIATRKYWEPEGVQYSKNDKVKVNLGSTKKPIYADAVVVGYPFPSEFHFDVYFAEEKITALVHPSTVQPIK